MALLCGELFVEMKEVSAKSQISSTANFKILAQVLGYNYSFNMLQWISSRLNLFGTFPYQRHITMYLVQMIKASLANPLTISSRILSSVFKTS